MPKAKTKTTTNKVNKTLDSLRKYLQMHGGDIQLVEITPDNVVRVAFSGACVGCSAAQQTLEFYIKESIFSNCPEIIDVEAVNMGLADHTPQGIPL